MWIRQGLFGFTQREVEALCKRDDNIYGVKIEGMQDWYDGYYMYAPEFNGEVGGGDPSDKEKGIRRSPVGL